MSLRLVSLPCLCALVLACASSAVRVDGSSVEAGALAYEIGPVAPSWRRVRVDDNDLAWFDRIVPCGITDAEVTTLSRELGRDVPVTEALPVVEGLLERIVAW